MKRAIAVGLLLSGCGPSERPVTWRYEETFPPQATTAVAGPTASAAPPTAPARGPVDDLRDRVLAESDALATVRALVDEAGPRLGGSAGAARAVVWAEKTMKAFGFDRVTREPVKERAWIRGPISVVAELPHARALEAVALGGSVSTRGKTVSAEVVELTSLEDLEKAPEAAIKGKIVFFHVVMERTRDGSGYGRAVKVRGLGPSAAAKKGAVAVLVRSIGTGSARSAHTGALRYAEDAPKIPAAALGIADADVMHRWIAAGQKVKLRLSLDAKDGGEVAGANVVGDVFGSEAKDEIVLLGAHLDSWDLGMGALDDGAGCAAVLEAAKHVARLPRRPRRTIRVVLFANEENGLAGATAYAEAHRAELDAHVVALEADLGDGRVFEARFRGDPTGRSVFASAASTLAPLGVAVVDAPAEGGADLIPLRKAGVPLVDLRQDATRYFDIHHTENDVFEAVEKRDLDQVAAAYAAFAYAIADRKEGLGRIPEGERERQH